MAEAVGLLVGPAGYVKELQASSMASRLPAVELIVFVGVADGDDVCAVTVKVGCAELQAVSSDVRGVGGCIGRRAGCRRRRRRAGAAGRRISR